MNFTSPPEVSKCSLRNSYSVRNLKISVQAVLLFHDVRFTVFKFVSSKYSALFST